MFTSICFLPFLSILKNLGNFFSLKQVTTLHTQSVHGYKYATVRFMGVRHNAKTTIFISSLYFRTKLRSMLKSETRKTDKDTKRQKIKFYYHTTQSFPAEYARQEHSHSACREGVLKVLGSTLLVGQDGEKKTNNSLWCLGQSHW